MSEISVRAGVPVTYQVLQADFAPELWREWIDRGVAANRRGAWLVPQVAGKPTSLMVGFQSTTHPFAHHRAYQEIAGLPLPERVAQAAPARGAGGHPGRGAAARRLRRVAAGQPAQALPAGRPAGLRAAARAQRHRARRGAGSQHRRGPLRPDARARRRGAPVPAPARLRRVQPGRRARDAAPPGHGARARRRRGALRRAVRRQPPDVHAGALGPRPQPRRAAPRRDRGAPADPAHGRALRLPRPRAAGTGPPGGRQRDRPRGAGPRAAARWSTTSRARASG